MIERTFQHIPGVGPWREKDLWSRGIMTWEDFPKADDNHIVLSRDADPVARERIAQAQNALAHRDLKALASLIPEREHWRLYGAFADQAVYFDIETDGRERQLPTVVSLFDKQGLRVFIEGRNMQELPGALAESPIWVTFNGSVFDVPVLKTHFPELVQPTVHLDLRFVCRKADLRGGLKHIEDELGIPRPLHLRGVNGYDAVLLWRAFHEHGDLEALRFLVEYNLYDSINLRSVLDLSYNRAVRELAVPVPPVPVFERGDILYDVSKLVLALSPTERDLRVLERVRGKDVDVQA